jgi:hypothetical protein
MVGELLLGFGLGAIAALLTIAAVVLIISTWDDRR